MRKLVIVLSVVAIGIYGSTFIFAKKHQEKNFNYEHKRPGCFRTCIRSHKRCTDIKKKECRDIFTKCNQKCFPAKVPNWRKTKKVVSAKAYFRFHIFPNILKEECGSCKKLCHHDGSDRGGVTCGGVSVVHNPAWFVQNMNLLNDCKVQATGYRLCPKKTLKTAAFKLYYKKYGKPFQKCSKELFPILVDSAVLSGVSTATKLIQRGFGIKQDGKFGPNTLRACNILTPEAFTNERIKRFKRLRQCKRYCKGWIFRAERVLKNSYKIGGKYGSRTSTK